MREADVLKQIVDYLNVRHVWNMRLNSGAMLSEYKGKKRMTRFCKPGTPDILAIQKVSGLVAHHILWIEVKAGKNAQSGLQKQFEREVIAEGHSYIVARSADDLAGLV